MTIVYRATRDDERFYLRVLPEIGATIAPEVRAHDLAREAGCAVPEIVYYEALDPNLERSIMVTTEIPGHPLAANTPHDVAIEATRSAGRDLARINLVPVDGFGWINRTMSDVPETLSAKSCSLAELIEQDYLPFFLTLPAGAVPGHERALLQKRIEEACALISAESSSRLVHGDFDTSHIFIHDGRYSGIIDFGEIRGMPWFYDLAHHQMHDSERLPYSTLGSLIEGYREVTPLPDGFAEQISAMSLLISARALHRGLSRSPDSQIVGTARRAIMRILLRVDDLS